MSRPGSSRVGSKTESTNHDCLRVSLATLWAPSIAVCNSPTYWSPSGGPVFPGLPNISSAGSSISLPNISLFREMCELLHVHRSRTAPCRPSANGQVHSFLGLFESFPSYPVGPFNSCLQLPYVLVGKNQRSWDKYLPQLARALRSSVNRSTGYTPNMMMLGREIGQHRTAALSVRLHRSTCPFAEGR
jgi:hypothetical protein